MGIANNTPNGARPAGWRSAPVMWISYVMVTVPVVAEVVRKALGGWTPTSDDGAFAVNAHDVFTSHPTWLGAASTVGANASVSGFHVFHLGPLQWWALAIPERFLTQRMGMAIGAALVVLVSVIGVVRIARRLGGQSVALWAAVSVAATMWSVGHITLAEPWNPFIALWPFVYCLVAAVEIAAGDLRSLPWFALATSFTVQCHYLFLVPVGAAALAAMIWWMLQRFHWQRATRRPTRRILFATAIVIAIAWLPSAIQQIRGRPGNLGEWWRATRTLTASHVPFEYALHYAVRTVGIAPLFARGPLDDSQMFLLGQPASLIAKLIAVLIVLGVVLFGVFGARRNTHGSALAVVALATLVGATFTISRYPATFPAFPHYRIVLLWPTGALIWFAFGAAIASTLTKWKPSLSALLQGRAVTSLGCAAAIAMGSAASVGASPPGPSTAVEQRATLRLVDKVLQNVNRDRHYVLAASGVSATFVQLGVLRELLRAGIHIGVSQDEEQLKSRYLVRDTQHTDRLVVVSGTLTAPPQTVLIAKFDGRGRSDQARVEQSWKSLTSTHATHTPRLRTGLVVTNGDALMEAIANGKLARELVTDQRLFSLIAVGDIRADREFIGAVASYARAVTVASERQFVVYIEPALGSG